MAATFWVFPNQEVVPRGAVFASHTPLSQEQREVLVSFAQPGLDLRAQQVRATVHTVGDRVTILDGSLGGHSQSQKIIEAIRGALREGRRSDLTWTADSPQVAPLIQQAFGSRSMAVAGMESARFVLVPAQRIWLSDGNDWVGIDLPPKLNAATLESLKSHPLTPTRDGADKVGQPSSDPPADVQPLSALHLEAAGWGQASPERRLQDLVEVARLLSERFRADQEAYRAALADWRQSLDRDHPGLLAAMPDPGTPLPSLPEVWRSLAESTVRSQLGPRSEAFLAAATVRQPGRGLLLVAGTKAGGLLIQGVGAP
ncbi:MAG: hypothetical protein KF884_07185 [Fimbriimonadaceae bacterium]|nr:hypothetical protein [Fimbriimonadaceae bacterium]QYK57333.1 MAG: hypothetical protein KF884_07185 [Fimbriimonadaceae bacterium]